MSAMTAEELARFFREGPFNSVRIEGITETDDTRYLGAVGLMRNQPIFRSILGFPFNGALSDTARFYLWPLKESVEGHSGVAVIFETSSIRSATRSPRICWLAGCRRRTPPG